MMTTSDIATASPLRVLHVIPAVARRYGGPSAAVTAMCVALLEQGIDVQIATTDADGPERLPVETGTLTTWNNVPTRFFRHDFSESFKYSRALSAWVRTAVSGFDVVHIHAVLSHAPLAAGSACRHAGVPYIVRPLGTIASWSLGRRSFRKRLLMTLGARRLLRGAAAMHYTSEAERADAEETHGLVRGVVIPLGVDLPPQDTAAVREAGSAPYVLALSRLHPKKNFEALIEAFAACREQLAGWRLVIAGDGEGDYERGLRALALRLGVDGDVTFHGWVDGEAKRRLLRGASLFVLPSHHENFGLVVLEAAAAGVPVVVTRGVHLAGDVERAGAGWISGTDPGSLRDTLLAAVVHPDERQRRGTAAREMAARFSWAAVATRLVALYQNVRLPGTRVGVSDPLSATSSPVSVGAGPR